MNQNDKTFKRHFRIYFVNNHPAYIVGEDGTEYYFHRVTHSKTSGGKKNWEKRDPLSKNPNKKMYIIKQEQKDSKKRFSRFELETYIDISYPEIKRAKNKKAGSLQTHSRTRYKSSNSIKTNEQK